MTLSFEQLRNATRAKHELRTTPPKYLALLTSELLEDLRMVLRRADLSTAAQLSYFSFKLGDLVCLFDHLACVHGIDLSHAVLDAFNTESDNKGTPVFIQPDGDWTEKP